MSSTINSGINSGVQLESNYGTITANFYKSDISAIRYLVHSLHRSLSTASDPFKQIQNELALLLAALDIAHSPGSQIVNDIHLSMQEELQECHQSLRRLRIMKVDHDSRGCDTTDFADLEDTAIEELQGIKRQLSSFTTTLSLININAIRSSQKHIEERLDRFLQQGDNLVRARSIVSSRSVSSDDRENWRNLRKELEAAGITAESFCDNLDLIVAIFKRSGLQDDMPELDSITRHSINLNSREFPVPEMERMSESLSMNNISSGESTASGFQRQLQSFSEMKPLRTNAIPPKAFPGIDDLASCSERGDLQSVMRKLQEGADINASNKDGDTALSLAAARGHKEIVLILFTKGAYVGAMNSNRESALVQAAKNGQHEILNILMSHAESIDDSQYHMALGAAAEHGHEIIVQLLLDRGVDADKINAEDEQDNTALFKAASNGHDGVVRVLLKHGVQLDTLNYWLESAMLAACRSNRERIARRLLRHGANFDTKAEDAALRHSELYRIIDGDRRMLQISRK